MRGCSVQILKYSLFIFNTIFAIAGIALIVVGAITYSEVSEYDSFSLSSTQGTSIVLIVAGSIIFLVAMLGCFGTFREVPAVLIIFAILLAVIFIIEIAVVITALVAGADVEEPLREKMEESMKRSAATDLKIWDEAQSDLKCCGVHSPADWIDLSKNKTLRTSCCRPEYIDEQTKDCRNAPPLFKDKYYQDGCLIKLKDIFKNAYNIIIGMGIGIGIVQIIGIILGCCLAFAIRKR